MVGTQTGGVRPHQILRCVWPDETPKSILEQEKRCEDCGRTVLQSDLYVRIKPGRKKGIVQCKGCAERHADGRPIQDLVMHRKGAPSGPPRVAPGIPMLGPAGRGMRGGPPPQIMQHPRMRAIKGMMDEKVSPAEVYELMRRGVLK